MTQVRIDAVVQPAGPKRHPGAKAARESDKDIFNLQTGRNNSAPGIRRTEGEGRERVLRRVRARR